MLLALGVAQRLLRYLLRFPVWGDEAFVCLNLMDRDYLGLLRPLRFDQVAPLLFLWGEEAVYRILGGSELALRLLPLLAGIGSLFLFARLAFAAVRPSAALLATGILAVSYYPVRHSCEVKPYAFDLFQSLLLLTPAVHWLRYPDRRRYLALLTAAAPLALASSYPAAFTAGTVSLALLPAIGQRRDKKTWLLFGLYNLLAGITVGGLFLGIGQAQHASMTAGCRGYWDAWFPPTDLRELPGWLLTVHAGNLLAYPAGGRDGGSAITLLLCLAGIASLALRRRDLLLLMLTPFVLTFLAALVGKYPYGGSARIAQHLAPSICLLAGTGASTLLRRLCRSPGQRWRGCLVLLSLLIVIGAVGLLHDIRKPYKTEGDERARHFVRTLLARTGGKPIVLLDAPPRLYPSLEWYLRLEGGDVTWAGSLADLPLDGATQTFWCLRFRTNDAPLDVLPPVWNGPHGVFALRARTGFLLGLGPERDDTHSCEVSQWARLAGGEIRRGGGKGTGP
ncbi:MAG: glycosyltransferase family 39 protein [Planctomycetes bacterium]|nr:glycosyltransferase family 39 protein [Planctomycetota bacterium]